MHPEAKCTCTKSRCPKVMRRMDDMVLLDFWKAFDTTNRIQLHRGTNKYSY